MFSPDGTGTLSRAVINALRGDNTASLVQQVLHPDDNYDAQLTLWVIYELHHGGFEDIAEHLEWDPNVMSVRRQLESELEATLRKRAPRPPESGRFAETFFDFVAAHQGPSLASYIHRKASTGEVHEFLRHKSIYHLKESDHTTWVIPRLSSRLKAAVMELQFDEYGAGNPHRVHSEMFARGLEASGLDPDYGTYIQQAPVQVLEQNNTMSMFGLNRRLRAASLGFLAAFEATSSVPSGKIAQGLGRLGFPAEMIEYYTEHVAADAVHEQLAVRTICQVLLEEEPRLYDDVYFGAWTSMDLEDRYAYRMLSQWAT